MSGEALGKQCFNCVCSETTAGGLTVPAIISFMQNAACLR